MGARLDRLPPSRWLNVVMVTLFLSWWVESYDIGLTGSVLPSLTRLYHLTTGQKSLFAISANIGIVVAIVPAGWLADRLGRKSVLTVGTLLYAGLTFATGLVSGIDEVLLFRFLAGLAMGAVFPLPYMYAAELAPPKLRGRMTGVADAFLSVGYFASPLIAAWLIPTASNSSGWRTMFFIGGIPALFALVIWRVVPESPRWSEAHGHVAEADLALGAIEARVQRETGHVLPPVPATAPGAPPPRVGLRTLLGPQYRRRSIMLWLTFGGIFFVFYSIQTFMPTVVEGMGFSLGSAFMFTAIIVGVSIPGKLLESWLVERWGRKPVIIVFAGVAGLAACSFGLAHGVVALLVVGGIMSFFGIGVDPAVKVYTAESYPTPIRAQATALTEGIGRLLSGVIGPSLIPPLLSVAGRSAVFVVVGLAALLSVAAVAFLGRESRSRSLEDFAAPSVSPKPR